MIIEADNADELWAKAAYELLSSDPVPAMSDDDVCRELINPTLVLTNPWFNKALTSRRMSEEYAEHEVMWYDQKTRSPSYINNFSSFWSKLTDAKGEVNSNYGWCIYKKYFDQWTATVKLLKADPKTRRAVIHIKEPLKYPKNLDCKDVNCTLTLQFLIRNSKLDLIVNMRSNDIWYGTPYDIYYFTIVLWRMSQELNICLGTYYHNVGSLHLYRRNISKVLDRLKGYWIEDPDLDLVNIKQRIQLGHCTQCTEDPVNCSVKGYCKYGNI